MAQVHPVGGRRSFYLAAAATAVFLIAAAIVILFAVMDTGGPPSPSSPAAVQPSQPSETPKSAGTQRKLDNTSANFGPVLAGSEPTVLDIPAIDVHASTLVGLGLAPDGSIEVPRVAANPGWFTPGPTPGQLGPSVIAGHVDSDSGPAVFYRLGELERGDRVNVTRQDGSTATFTVDRVQAFAKSKFPTHAVYGNTTNRAELRLITCGGAYDEQTGYQSNTVAFAHLVA